MKIGYLQFKPKLFDVEENIKRIDELIGDNDFDLLVIPELASTGYLFVNKSELQKYSVPAGEGIYFEYLRYTCKRKDCFIVSGFCERERGRKVRGYEEDGINYYNSSILVYPDGNYNVYRKIHLFNEEKFLFEPGNLPFEVNEIEGKRFGKARVGMMICFDWIFPEAARVLALKGAQIICHPSNLVMPYCQKAMYARAVENHVFIITANRFEKDVNGNKEVEFSGRSVILNTKGDYIAEGSADNDECMIVEINQYEANDKMINENNNVIQDRREEFYN
jgi:predicted amidohydrolase